MPISDYWTGIQISCVAQDHGMKGLWLWRIYLIQPPLTRTCPCYWSTSKIYVKSVQNVVM